MRAAVVLAAAALAGCVATAPREPDRLRTPFDAREHEPYAQPGTGAVQGQAFLRQVGGGVVTCAGSEVWLTPATEYFLEASWYAKEGRRLEHEAAAAAQLPRIVRRTRCDAQGRFSFAQLPAGKYIVLTEVAWVVAGVRQGGVVMAATTVAPAETAAVLISDRTPLR